MFYTDNLCILATDINDCHIFIIKDPDSPHSVTGNFCNHLICIWHRHTAISSSNTYIFCRIRIIFHKLLTNLFCRIHTAPSCRLYKLENNFFVLVHNNSLGTSRSNINSYKLHILSFPLMNLHNINFKIHFKIVCNRQSYSISINAAILVLSCPTSA